MNIKAYKVKAFAKEIHGGNIAGVVPNANDISDEKKQLIAAQLGFSETAFVSSSKNADFKVQFFTPTEEVDLCGHATIGTFSVLLNSGIIKAGNYTQETKAGVLNVDVQSDGTVLMEQTLPYYGDILPRDEISSSLNMESSLLDEKLPIQIISTGLKDIFIPIKDLETLKNINPDYKKIENISKKYDVIGYHLFTLDTQNEATAHCRNFAPLYGIPEEAATGTSNGALACYLYEHKVVTTEKQKTLIFDQGYTMNLPSEIFASLNVDENKITRINVGGKGLDQTEIHINL
jgi:PhzF family phenazine biosynthesis protein